MPFSDFITVNRSNITLSGYAEWHNMFQNKQLQKPIKFLKSYAALAENMKWLAMDTYDLPLGNERTQLVRWLKYWYFGIDACLVAIEHMEVPNGISEWIDNLRSALVPFRFQMIRLDTNLSPLSIGGANFTIPNISGLAELIRGWFNALFPDEKRSFSLFDLKQMAMNLAVVQGCRTRRPDFEKSNIGLPAVIFSCLGHNDSEGNPIIVIGTSPDGIIWREMAIWREARFDNPTDRNYLQNIGRTAGEAFDKAVDRAIITISGFEERFRQSPKTWTDRDFESLNDQVYQELARWPYGANHLSEAGRSFRGCDNNMFSEMSRCWKCRFGLHWDLDPRGLEREHPSQTALVANRPLNCAEDETAYQCMQLPLASLRNPPVDFPPQHFGI